jgi:hypothetical protein
VFPQVPVDDERGDLDPVSRRPRGKGRVGQVLPDTVASTPLGVCLVGVAKETTFGAQPKAVTFRVPIHANVGGS